MPRVTSTTQHAASAAMLVAALGLAGPGAGAADPTRADRPERSTVRDHLLGADRLPVLAGREWKVGPRGGPGGAAAVGACQKTPLDTLGAVATGRRSYTAGGGKIRATQVVARFVDPRSAWRAHQVLRAWREDCEDRVTHATVGPMEPVFVRNGTADTYRASYTRSGVAGLAIHRSGAYLTIVEVTAARRRYPESWDPARKAVRRIARTF